jgi:hypothetical protein
MAMTVSMVVGAGAAGMAGFRSGLGVAPVGGRGGWCYRGGMRPMPP